jgi:hypothetical protein
MVAALMGVDWSQPVLTVFETCKRLHLKPSQVRRLCSLYQLAHWKRGHTLARAESSVIRLLEEAGGQSALRTHERQLELGLEFPGEPKEPEDSNQRDRAPPRHCGYRG